MTPYGCRLKPVRWPDPNADPPRDQIARKQLCARAQPCAWQPVGPDPASPSRPRARWARGRQDRWPYPALHAQPLLPREARAGRVSRKARRRRSRTPTRRLAAPSSTPPNWKGAVTISRKSTLRKVVLAVGAALDRHGVKAVLTGGACASIHSAGAYTSLDLDFVVTSQTTQQTLDTALADIGFSRMTCPQWLYQLLRESEVHG